MFKFLKDKEFSYHFIIWFIIFVWYFIFAYQFFSPIRYKTKDFFAHQAFYIFPSFSSKAKDIVVVAIDERSRQYLGIKWPWRRSVTARLIEKIAQGSPKVIGLDILFSGSSTPEDDRLLSQVLDKFSKRIVLGYVIKKGLVDLPYQEFRKGVSLGFVNKPSSFYRDRGERNVARTLRAFYIDEQKIIHYSIEIKILAKYLGLREENIKVNIEKGLSLDDKLFIPSRRGVIPINYLVHPADFFTIPAYLILEDKINPLVFKDKIVLVGATDPLIHDLHYTPLGIMPGISIIGNSLVMMLTQRFIKEISLGLLILLTIFVGIVFIFINKKMSLGSASLITFFILTIFYFLALYLRSKDWEFDYFTFFFLAISAYLSSNVYKYSYLIYVSNRLKNLAIKDPLTDFYTFRYFMVKIEEDLKDKLKEFVVVIFLVKDYRRFVIDLSFDEIKASLRMVANFLDNRFKEIPFYSLNFRISQDAMGVVLNTNRKKDIENFVNQLLEEINRKGIPLKDKTISISLKAGIVYKKSNLVSTKEELMSKIEYLLKELRKKEDKNLITMEIEERKGWERKEKTLSQDDMEFLLSDVEERNRELERMLKELLDSKKETEEAYFQLIRSLIKALEEKDSFTQGHSERVARYAKAIAEEVGLDREKCELIYKAGLLHDIGKIGIPDYLLHKKGKLTEDELSLIRKHEIMSVDILKPIKAFEKLLPIILHHHERYDGTGYPYGLSKDMIPQESQILAVADAFDAITCGRGYKKGMSVEEAIKEIERGSGTQFNPKYVEALKKVIAKGMVSKET